MEIFRAEQAGMWEEGGWNGGAKEGDRHKFTIILRDRNYRTLLPHSPLSGHQGQGSTSEVFRYPADVTPLEIRSLLSTRSEYGALKTRLQSNAYTNPCLYETIKSKLLSSRSWRKLNCWLHGAMCNFPRLRMNVFRRKLKNIFFSSCWIPLGYSLEK